MALQGPHQGAQKSTKTRPEPAIVVLKEEELRWVMVSDIWGKGIYSFWKSKKAQAREATAARPAMTGCQRGVAPSSSGSGMGDSNSSPALRLSVETGFARDGVASLSAGRGAPPGLAAREMAFGAGERPTGRGRGFGKALATGGGGTMTAGGVAAADVAASVEVGEGEVGVADIGGGGG